MLCRTALFAIAAGAVFTMSSPHARGQELVQNGGFETGDFTGWQEFGDTQYNGVDDYAPRTGTFEAYFGPITTGGIQQTLTVAAGSTVQVSFWYESEFGDVPNSLVATLGSVQLVSLNDITNLNYVQFTATVTVAETNPVLMFTFSDPLDYIDLDDVSVIVVGGGNPCGTADFDGDGDTGTDADIEAFFACLGGNCCATCYSGGADFNGDGDTGTDADIEAFFRVLSGGNC